MDRSQNDKKRLRLIRYLLFAVCAVLAEILSACGEQDTLPNFNTLFPETESNETATEAETEIEAPFAKRIRLVLPEERSVELYERTKRLGDAITEKTGIPYTVVSDQNLSAYHPDVYELVIGESAHPDCAYWMRGLKKEDYVCAAGRYAAVLGGKTEAATFLALDYFTECILPKSCRRFVIEIGTQVVEKKQYERAFVSWNGVELSEWTVACPSDADAATRSLAEMLTEEIDRISGYRLSLAYGSDWKEKENTVFLSVEEALGEEVRLISEEGRTLLSAGTGVGLHQAVSEFLDRLFEDTDGDRNCENRLDSTETFLAERSAFRLGLVIGDSQMQWSQVSEIVSVSDWIRNEERDAVFVSELMEETANHLWQNFEDYTWKKIGTERGVASFCAVGEIRSLPDEYASIDGCLGATRIGGSLGGFRWLVLREGTELPEWVYEDSMPLLVTVCGTESGRLTESSESRLDCHCTETVTADGKDRLLSVYTSTGLFSVRNEVRLQKAGTVDLWVSRLY